MLRPIPLALVRLLLLLTLAATSTAAQAAQPIAAASDPPPSANDGAAASAAAPAQDLEPTRFDWAGAARQSFFFLSAQHSARMLQPKTRAQMGGPFFKDWRDSIRGVRGWGDGDSVFTNYVAHPMQGAVSGYIQIHNDPRGRKLEISNTPEYWHSRLRAMGFAALYSTNFEIGVLSEATIGNVGKKPGTSGWVDFVVTPTGGFGMIVAEDWLDRHVVRRLEGRTQHAGKRRFYRTLFNPQRSFANLMRGKLPWHRDTRPLRDGEYVKRPAPIAPPVPVEGTLRSATPR